MSRNKYGEPSNSIDAVVRRLEAYTLTLEDLPQNYRLEAQRAVVIIRKLQRELSGDDHGEEIERELDGEWLAYQEKKP